MLTDLSTKSPPLELRVGSISPKPCGSEIQNPIRMEVGGNRNAMINKMKFMHSRSLKSRKKKQNLTVDYSTL